MPVSWRNFAEWAKHRPAALKLADRLGRGRGRFRYFDHVSPPPRARITPDLRDWNARELSAVWIGHATTMLRIGGKTILTDPVFSNRIGVGLGLITGGPRRITRAALSLRELPRIDLILISHAHFDHLDRPTLRRLDKHIPVVTSTKTSDLIRDLGFSDVKELAWGDSISVAGLQVRARQVTHWGARTFFDQHRGYNAYLIDSGSRRILFGGDTAFQSHFDDVGGVDLAILGIGAYDPYIQAHATPEQAWQMAQRAGAKFLMPIHHSTFMLSYEDICEPIARLLEVARDHTLRIVAREVGDQWSPA